MIRLSSCSNRLRNRSYVSRRISPFALSGYWLSWAALVIPRERGDGFLVASLPGMTGDSLLLRMTAGGFDDCERWTAEFGARHTEPSLLRGGPEIRPARRAAG